MPRITFLLPILIALSAAGCMRHEAPNPVASRATPPQQASAAAQPQAVAAEAYAAVPDRHAAAPLVKPERPYVLDSGDKLRVVVFGQQGISGSYLVDASGNVNVPLIGTVPARGLTTQQLAGQIVRRLERGYMRDPHVTVAIETYRPFFILGEVTNPGQYPYVPQMTAENAVAIAGGFSPRAYKSTVQLTRTTDGDRYRGNVPLSFSVRPGDTIVVKERWF